jgi:hypothetical protein
VTLVESKHSVIVVEGKCLALQTDGFAVGVSEHFACVVVAFAVIEQLAKILDCDDFE